MWAGILSLVACREEPGPGDGRDDDPSSPHSAATTSESAAPSSTATTGATGDTAEGETMPWERSDYDCSSVPRGMVSGTRMAWAPSSEDFTLSPDGYLWGVPAGLLKRVPYGGPAELVVPGLGDVRGMRFLPDGRLAMAHPEDGSVYLVDPTTGGWTVAAAGLNTPNGVAIDFEGRIAVATQQRIVRIDPATGDVEELVFMERRSFDGLVYSPDFRRLYFNEELGRVHWIEFADDGTWSEPLGALQVGEPLIPFGILDGMAVDVCGNLYASEMNGRLWRVWLDGEIEQVAEIGGVSIVPALNFGLPAQGGWIADHLYVMDFTGALVDLPMGVPGKWEPHLPWPE
jgi:sugar lactone lactonase YvrE